MTIHPIDRPIDQLIKNAQEAYASPGEKFLARGENGTLKITADFKQRANIYDLLTYLFTHTIGNTYLARPMTSDRAGELGQLHSYVISRVEGIISPTIKNYLTEEEASEKQAKQLLSTYVSVMEKEGFDAAKERIKKLPFTKEFDYGNLNNLVLTVVTYPLLDYGTISAYGLLNTEEEMKFLYFAKLRESCRLLLDLLFLLRLQRETNYHLACGLIIKNKYLPSIREELPPALLALLDAIPLTKERLQNFYKELPFLLREYEPKSEEGRTLLIRALAYKPAAPLKLEKTESYIDVLLQKNYLHYFAVPEVIEKLGKKYPSLIPGLEELHQYASHCLNASYYFLLRCSWESEQLHLCTFKGVQKEVADFIHDYKVHNYRGFYRGLVAPFLTRDWGQSFDSLLAEKKISTIEESPVISKQDALGKQKKSEHQIIEGLAHSKVLYKHIQHMLEEIEEFAKRTNLKVAFQPQGHPFQTKVIKASRFLGSLHHLSQKITEQNSVTGFGSMMGEVPEEHPNSRKVTDFLIGIANRVYQSTAILPYQQWVSNYSILHLEDPRQAVHRTAHLVKTVDLFHIPKDEPAAAIAPSEEKSVEDIMAELGLEEDDVTSLPAAHSFAGLSKKNKGLAKSKALKGIEKIKASAAPSPSPAEPKKKEPKRASAQIAPIPSPSLKTEPLKDVILKTYRSFIARKPDAGSYATILQAGARAGAGDLPAPSEKGRIEKLGSFELQDPEEKSEFSEEDEAMPSLEEGFFAAASFPVLDATLPSHRYAERVLKWFSKPEEVLAAPSYARLTPENQKFQEIAHTFPSYIDALLIPRSSKDPLSSYCFEGTWIQAKKQHCSYRIPGEIQWKGRNHRGAFEITLDEKGVIYHRHFREESPTESLADLLHHQGPWEGAFPTIKESLEFPKQEHSIAGLRITQAYGSMRLERAKDGAIFLLYAANWNHLG